MPELLFFVSHITNRRYGDAISGGEPAMKNNNERDDRRKLPVGKNEDVEFSRELADQEDMEALERMEAADRRQQ